MAANSSLFDDGTLVNIAERDVQRDPPACELDVEEPTEAARALLRDQGITVVPVAPVAASQVGAGASELDAGS